HRLVRGELLQPLLVILVQSAFVVVDEDRRRDMHRIHENESFPDAAFANALSDLRRDVDETSPGRNVEPEFLSIALHKPGLSVKRKRLRPTQTDQTILL